MRHADKTPRLDSRIPFGQWTHTRKDGTIVTTAEADSLAAAAKPHVQDEPELEFDLASALSTGEIVLGYDPRHEVDPLDRFRKMWNGLQAACIDGNAQATKVCKSINELSGTDTERIALLRHYVEVEPWPELLEAVGEEKAVEEKAVEEFEKEVTSEEEFGKEVKPEEKAPADNGPEDGTSSESSVHVPKEPEPEGERPTEINHRVEAEDGMQLDGQAESEGAAEASSTSSSESEEAKPEEKAPADQAVAVACINVAALRHFACGEDWLEREAAPGSWTLAEWAQRVEQRCYSVQNGAGTLAFVNGSRGYRGKMKELPDELTAEMDNGVRVCMLGLSLKCFPED